MPSTPPTALAVQQATWKTATHGGHARLTAKTHKSVSNQEGRADAVGDESIN